MTHGKYARQKVADDIGMNADSVGFAVATAVSSKAQIEIGAPPSRIWELLSNIERWPTWNPLVKTVAVSGPLQPGTVFRWKSGGFAVTSTLRDVTPKCRIVWTGTALGTRALHLWEIDESSRGTTLKTAEWFGGWLPRLMPTITQRSLDDALQKWLNAIKAAAERGN